MDQHFYERIFRILRPRISDLTFFGLWAEQAHPMNLWAKHQKILFNLYPETFWGYYAACYTQNAAFI